MKIIEAVSPNDYLVATDLFKEYAGGLGIDLGFQHFEEELKLLPAMYGRPSGILFLVWDKENPIACTGVRSINKDIAELKRMFVRPAYRNNGIAQQLLDASLDFAGKAGYKKIRLDTLDHMLPAISLYEKNGFLKISAYYFNPEPNAVYFEKDLVPLMREGV